MICSQHPSVRKSANTASRVMIVRRCSGTVVNLVGLLTTISDRYRAPTFQVIDEPGVIAELVMLHTDQLNVFAVT